MDYRRQALLNNRYQNFWLIGSALLFIVASLALRERHLSVYIYLTSQAALLMALGYLPKYLHVNWEPEKRYAWAVRSRWILIPAAVLLAMGLSRFSRPVMIAAILSALWLLAANFLVKLIFRRATGKMMVWMPVLYFITDFWMAQVLAFVQVEIHILAAILTASVVFTLLLDDRARAWLALLIAFVAALLLWVAGGVDDREFGLFLACVLAATVVLTYTLMRLATRWAADSHANTIEELGGFNQFAPEETEDWLLASRQRLVDAWKQFEPDPNDRDALARWYADHSREYLFDIARFHLTYKHIAFTQDVLKISRGRVLDYGAGKGALSLELARRGNPVTYYDVPGISRKFAEWSAQRQNLGVTFTSAKSEILAKVAASGKFDTIISLDVLEHMPDLEGELRFLHSVLAPGGTMIMTVPIGATESHPMHLAHDLDTRAFLQNLGLRDVKSLLTRWQGSEILRKPDCLVYQLPG